MTDDVVIKELRIHVHILSIEKRTSFKSETYSDAYACGCICVQSIEYITFIFLLIQLS